jgi:hypothetical protein
LLARFKKLSGPNSLAQVLQLFKQRAALIDVDGDKTAPSQVVSHFAEHLGIANSLATGARFLRVVRQRTTGSDKKNDGQ